MKKLLLIILLSASSALAGAQAKGDSLKYDITKLPGWDPTWDINDPNCPCHEIQRKAEKEYAELLEKEKKGEAQQEKAANVQTNGGGTAAVVQTGGPANSGEGSGGGSSSAGRTRSNKRSLKKFFYNTGKSINKIMPKRKKKNKLDDCWH